MRLEELVGDIGALPWEAVECRVVRRRRRRRVTAALLTTALVVVLVAGLLVTRPGGPDVILDSAPEPPAVRIPPTGEARGELVDGLPVWVVSARDGPHVLAATTPHLDEPLHWCPRATAFADPLHGTYFDAQGRWLAGPAGSGLLELATEPLEDDPGTLRVLTRRERSPMDVLDGPGPRADLALESPASICAGDELVPPPSAPSVGWEGLGTAPHGQTVRVDAVLRTDAEGAVLCPLRGGCGTAVPVRSTLLSPLWLDASDQGACRARPGTWQVRAEADGLHDLARADGLGIAETTCEDLDRTAEASALDVPALGEPPRFTLLDDQTPVAAIRTDAGPRVLAATTRPFLGIRQLVAWCPPESDPASANNERLGGFLASGDGSSFLADGSWSRGPAPAGLDRYPVEELGGGRVRVLGPAEEQPRPSEPAPEQVAGCVFDRDPSQLVPFAELPVMGVAEAAAREGERVAVEGALLPVPGGAVLCDPSGVTAARGCDGPRLQVLGATPDEAPGYAPIGTLIGRVAGGALIDPAWSAARVVDVVPADAEYIGVLLDVSAEGRARVSLGRALSPEEAAGALDPEDRDGAWLDAVQRLDTGPYLDDYCYLLPQPTELGADLFAPVGGARDLPGDGTLRDLVERELPTRTVVLARILAGRSLVGVRELPLRDPPVSTLMAGLVEVTISEGQRTQGFSIGGGDSVQPGECRG